MDQNASGSATTQPVSAEQFAGAIQHLYQLQAHQSQALMGIGGNLSEVVNHQHAQVAQSMQQASGAPNVNSSDDIPQEDPKDKTIRDLQAKVQALEKSSKKTVSQEWPPTADQHGYTIYYIPDHLVKTGKTGYLVTPENLQEHLKAGTKVSEVTGELQGFISTDHAIRFLRRLHKGRHVITLRV